MRQRKETTMRKMMSLAGMLILLMSLTIATPAISGAKPLEGDGPATKKDEHPCGEPYWHNGAQDLVQKCLMWRGDVPVYNAGLGDPNVPDEIVGYLENAKGNWFVCQAKGAEYTVPGTDYTNVWYASTMADNGEWGYVPIAYFSGGGNNQPDGGLAHC
jgi:hypothetical protein